MIEENNENIENNFEDSKLFMSHKNLWKYI